MDFYGMSSAGPDGFGVDEFLDFSGGDRDEHLSSSTATGTHLFHNITSSSASGSQFQYGFNDNSTITTDFTDHFCFPSDDVAELEWLSKFVDDSASNFPANNIAGTINFRPETPSFHSRSRTKRTRAPSTNTSWTSTSTPMPTTHTSEKSCETTSEPNTIRRCTHCASEKTPQWRTGPLGPKTLCNACGVRYKSGRLVPEYRPAASPTFVLTQHSNSHRKVMELRRQKEMIIGVNQHHHQHHHQHHQQQHLVTSEHQIYAGRHNHRQQHHGSNYEVC